MAGSKKKKSEPSGPDLYAELSVAKNASTEEIKKAYRRLALQVGRSRTRLPRHT